jgi:hypothetical protein
MMERTIGILTLALIATASGCASSRAPQTAAAPPAPAPTTEVVAPSPSASPAFVVFSTAQVPQTSAAASTDNINRRVMPRAQCFWYRETWRPTVNVCEGDAP